MSAPTWVLVISCPDGSHRHVVPESDRHIAGHVHALAPGERFSRVSASTFRDLQTALAHPVVIGYVGGRRTTVVIPESADAAARHAREMERDGERTVTVSLADYTRHGPDEMLARHLAGGG